MTIESAHGYNLSRPRPHLPTSACARRSGRPCSPHQLLAGDQERAGKLAAECEDLL